MKYKIEYGSTYAGGEAHEDVIEASSQAAADEIAMNRAAQLCCFWRAEPVDDEAKAAEMIKAAGLTTRAMVRTLAESRGVSAADDFANALETFCNNYVQQLGKGGS